MNTAQRQAIIETSWALHAEVERSVLAHPASRHDAQWRDKQRLLLADMALHLLQTALNPGELKIDKLQNNLHAILTICDQFLPHAELKQATNKLYSVI
ncbi:MAG: hypothetical protein HWE26_06955 [Alteromonadaceae bacterium]|nr:hypothetical protein [Alteromonadaceae bacterium]